MANNSYLRSTKRERELVNKFRSQGYQACRSAGSHSPWDVWAWNPASRTLVLIQVKTKRGARQIVEKSKVLFENCIVKTSTYSWE